MRVRIRIGRRVSDFTEGVGSAFESTLAGRAIEPHHGEKNGILDNTTISDKPPACLNCGAVVDGTYCQNCGQKRHVHRSLTAIAHDLVHGVLHLDGKLWRTLPLLTFKPGEITRRYIEGERATFVSPMAMFLFSVFAMFAVFQMVGLTAPTMSGGGTSASGRFSIVAAELTSEREEIAAKIQDRETDRTDSTQLQQELETIDNQISALETAESLTAVDNGVNLDANVTGIRSIDDELIEKWRENPGLMLYKLQANGFKFSWLLIPLSIPFMSLIFAWRRQFKAYDHATFVTYSLAFMSLLFIAASILATIPSGWWFSINLMLIVPPIHMYKHLRGAYALSRFSAFWRLMALSIFVWIVAVLFLQALLLLGAA